MLAADPPRARSTARRIRVWGVACAVLLVTVCGEPPAGPGASADRAVRLAFQPAFDVATHAAFEQVASSIDNVHLVLRNAVGAVVLDTTVAFPAGQDSVAVAASVSVHGESERFSVKFELRSGTTTMFEGTEEVTARPGINAQSPATVPLVF